ncbi:hypothetical protein P7H22_20660 [Paenibacillus larvae]|nr:hypothetical protein [Paenibacillus larvae]MDT2242279.1 hypothetical protein [Paenibacillus larvae]
MVVWNAQFVLEKFPSVNTQKHAVRVAFSDVSAVSSEIPVLRFANEWAKDSVSHP